MLIKVENITSFVECGNGTIDGMRVNTQTMYIEASRIDFVVPYKYWGLQVDMVSQVRIAGSTFQFKITPDKLYEEINRATAPRNLKLASGGL